MDMGGGGSNNSSIDEEEQERYCIGGVDLGYGSSDSNMKYVPSSIEGSSLVFAIS
jgi:hypothetical protein